MARDTKALTDCVEYFDPLTPQAIKAAQRTVCHYAHDAADAAELMWMLGIYPAQEAEPTTTIPPSPFS